MHGDTPQVIGSQIADMTARRMRAGLPPLNYGMAAFMICRPTDDEAEEEWRAISHLETGSSAYASYQDFVSQSHLTSKVSMEDYVVSNRGLRPRLVGSPDTILRKIAQYQDVGIELLLIQASPMLEEMDIIGKSIIPFL